MKKLASRSRFEEAVVMIKQDRLVLRALAVGIIFGLAYSVWLQYEVEHPWINPELLSLGPLAMGIAYYFLDRGSRRRYKDLLVGVILRDRFPQWRYQAEGGITYKQLFSTGLFDKPYTDATSEDQFITERRGVKVRFAECTLRYSRATRSDQDYNLKVLIMAAKLPVATGQILLLPSDGKEKKSWVRLSRLKPLGDEEFDGRHEIFSDSPEHVRKLLTKDFRFALEKVQEMKLGASLRVSLLHGQLTLAFFDTKDRFEPPTLGRLDETRIARELAREVGRFAVALDVVDALLDAA